MMREIKFRVWDKINENMLYPSNKIFLNMNGKIVYESSIDGEIVEALDGTYELIQYTGLKDKNGKEIYEGDIVKAINRRYDNKDDMGKYFEKLEVRFVNGCFMIGDWNAHEYYNRFTFKEVIGNIYENEYLLKGETK